MHENGFVPDRVDQHSREGDFTLAGRGREWSGRLMDKLVRSGHLMYGVVPRRDKEDARKVLAVLKAERRGLRWTKLGRGCRLVSSIEVEGVTGLRLLPASAFVQRTPLCWTDLGVIRLRSGTRQCSVSPM